MAYTIGRPLVYGVKEPMPLSGFPPGRVRIRMRQNRFAVAYVRTSDGVRGFAIEVFGETWQPGPELGHNLLAKRAAWGS